MQHRIDIRPTEERVRVEIDGAVVADSSDCLVLEETGLPPRYYFPKQDVRMELLRHTDHASRCPFKGKAEYWSVGPHNNVAWSYPDPIDQSAQIAGRIAFYNERTTVSVG